MIKKTIKRYLYIHKYFVREIVIILKNTKKVKNEL